MCHAGVKHINHFTDEAGVFCPVLKNTVLWGNITSFNENSHNLACKEIDGKFLAKKSNSEPEFHLLNVFQKNVSVSRTIFVCDKF